MAETESGKNDSVDREPRWRLGLSLRRSEAEGQPRWVLPALAITAAAAGLLYAWQATGNLEIFYAAGVRSMSSSWHDFFFAAFDPRGTVSLDKLPGAFWVQALSARLFGFSAGSIVAPQVAEGVLTVLVLFRAVGRLAGPMAGISAAVVLAVSPATVALNRGNISDTLMVLLLVLAANSTVSALLTGRARHMALAGLWVGLAFQAKMLEAWLVLPALLAVYLLCGPQSVRRRVVQLAGMIAVAGAVSLSWMSLVSLLPASGRPYVDGSPDDSLFHQVFVYNGFGRLNQASPDQVLNQALGLHLDVAGPGSWHRFLSGQYGLDTGWLIPAVAVILIVGFVARRREPRDDRVRAGLVLWGVWLAVFLVALSADSSIHPYYAAVFSPALAAVIGLGIATALASASASLESAANRRRSVAAVVAGIVVLSVAYAAWLLPDHGTGLPAWLLPLTIAVGAIAAGCIALPERLPRRASLLATPSVCLTAALAAVLLIPVVASVSMVADHLGPFDTPFESAAAHQAVRDLVSTAPSAAALPKLEAAQLGAPDLMATETSALAASFIYLTGREVLPIGGFTGTIPAPSLSQLETMIQAGQFHVVLQSSAPTDPRLVWVAQHCQTLPHTSNAQLVAYFCGTATNPTSPPQPAATVHRHSAGAVNQVQLLAAALRVKAIITKYPGFTVPPATLLALKANPTDAAALAKARQVLGPDYLSELAALTQVPPATLRYLQKWGPIVRKAVADGRLPQ